MDTEKKLESTAYHETGHTIMSWLMNIPVKKITIIPTEEYLGRIYKDDTAYDELDWESIDEWDWETRKILEERIMVALAGRIAEENYLGHSANQVYTDEEDAFQLIAQLSSSKKEIQAYYDWLYIRTEHKICSETNWYFLESVAKELIVHKELSGERVYEIIGNAAKERIKPIQIKRSEE